VRVAVSVDRKAHSRPATETTRIVVRNMNYIKKSVEINNNGSLLEITKTTTSAYIIRTSIVFLLMMISFYVSKTPLFVVIVFGLGFVFLLGYYLKKDTVEIDYNKSIIKRYSTVLSKDFKYDFNIKLTEPLIIYSKADYVDGNTNYDFYIKAKNKKYPLFMSQEEDSVKILRTFLMNNEIIFNSNKIELREE
jgi:hypothetical protein